MSERRDDPARSGMEHLQAAAREVIQATRSLLDAAEELVDDPAAVQNLVGTLTSLAQTAAGRLRPDTSSGTGGPGDDNGDDGLVHRIRVS